MISSGFSVKTPCKSSDGSSNLHANAADPIMKKPLSQASENATTVVIQGVMVQSTF